MASSTKDRPDLGLPLLGEPFEQESELNTAADWFASPLTVRERSMIGLMLALKDKPEWDRKVFDEEIVAKWRKEALDFKPEVKYVRNSEGEDPWDSSEHNGENLNVDGEARQKVVSEEMFDWCIAELRDNATQYRERGFTQAIDANACVYMSDGAVSSETKAKLREGAERLENVHDWQKDWHPGSDGKVLDLVHPSLFPLLYGRSRILPSGEVPLEKCAWSTGEGIVFPKPKRPEDVTSYDVYSENFQWLPCQAFLDSEGKVKITSYINNLYPSGNEDLYAAIEQVMAASVPLWIETILSTQFLTTHRIKHDFGDGRVLPQEVVDRHRREAEERARRLQEDGGYQSDGNDSDPEDEYVADIPRLRDFKPRRRVNKSVFEIGYGNRLTGDVDVEMKNPSIEPTEEQLEEGQKDMETEATNIREVFQDPDHGLQVIVKLANIHLTPEKPTYDGGSWHIEGQENEHIIASALYYYDSENITDSYLAFREGSDRDELQEYDQHQYQALMEIYGLKDSWGNAIQVLGSVHTREDRLLVFPNVLQHRVSPFSLADKSRAGHRKLLALFLVEPFIKIPSTANIPPQQRDWWKKAMEEKGSLTQRLPVELADHVVEAVEDFPIGLEEAEKLREQLMDERRNLVEGQMSSYADNGYCFCEH
ncbi:hypothetical protein PRZ48_002382 [Zasmidium cellare]|uniref:Uncharacterized protein n=1 Tax=Zasmidium cellare TaxID=395010 RepID=A0ABR0F6X1_ZASCE|nr:hypothetical protein PRZ48_002382 [Zasmidium cellare]